MDVRVTFYLKKSETNADGCCPVMARLTVGNHSEAAFSAKMSVPVSSWTSGRTDIPFTALNRSFIDRYDLYLRTERRIAPGTIVLLTTRLNTIVGEAVSEGIITADPFAGYEPKRPERVQKYLTADELHRLMTTPLHHPTLYHTRDLFLFSLYIHLNHYKFEQLRHQSME